MRLEAKIRTYYRAGGYIAQDKPVLRALASPRKIRKETAEYSEGKKFSWQVVFINVAMVLRTLVLLRDHPGSHRCQRNSAGGGILGQKAPKWQDCRIIPRNDRTSFSYFQPTSQIHFGGDYGQ